MSIENLLSRKICPRCGQEFSYLEKQVKNGRVYYVAVHYLGYEKTPDGKVKKKVKKCYLGPINYEYVTRLHNFTLHGMIVSDRELKYLEEILIELRNLKQGMKELQEQIIQRMDKIIELLSQGKLINA